MNKAQLRRYALKLYKEEYTYAEISREIDKPRSTVHRWVNDLLDEEQLKFSEMEQSETKVEQSGTESKQFDAKMDDNGTNNRTNSEGMNISGTAKSSYTEENETKLSENPEYKDEIESIQKKHEKDLHILMVLKGVNKGLGDQINQMHRKNVILDLELKLFESLYNITDDEYEEETIPESINKVINEFIKDFSDYDDYEISVEQLRSYEKIAHVLLDETENWIGLFETHHKIDELAKILQIIQTEVLRALKLHEKNGNEPKISISQIERRSIEEYLN